VLDSPTRSRSRPRWRRIALFILLNSALLGSLTAVVVLPRVCFYTEPERHGLACDIPLPLTAVLERVVKINGEIPPGVETQNLQFQVRDTTNEEVRAFYVKELPERGWTCIKADDAYIMSALKGSRDIGVMLSPPAEAGGRVVMLITISTFAQGITAPTC
jgi:hypothetical protein